MTFSKFESLSHEPGAEIKTTVSKSWLTAFAGMSQTATNLDDSVS